LSEAFVLVCRASIVILKALTGPFLEPVKMLERLSMLLDNADENIDALKCLNTDDKLPEI
jgi:hypothetical protein